MKPGGGGAGCVRRGGGCGQGRGSAMSFDETVRGFTLIEVLIALAIVAIAMGAVLRAIGSLAADTDSARAHLLALWSADNALSELRITSAWPEPGQKTFACPQGAYRFVCRQVVTVMPSPIVRQVTVSVYPSVASRGVLAEVVTVVQNEARR